MDRREFLKRTFQLAGIAGLYSLGAGAIEEAIAVGIMPAVAATGEVSYPPAKSAGGASAWAAWNEANESTLAVAGVTDVALMENVAAGGDETTGNGLTLTQIGTIAGMASARRCLDGVNDEFRTTVDFTNLLCGQPTWTIFGKFYGIETTSGIFEFSDRPVVPVQHAIEIGYVGNVPYLYVVLNGVAKADQAMAAPSNVINFYMLAWCDGEYVRAGWCTTKPTKWTDFAAANRVSVTTACQFTAGDFTRRQIGNNVDRMMNGCIYFFGVSSTCFIDNNL